MQENNPYILLLPSRSQVARDWALSIVQQLQDLNVDNPTLMDTFVTLCRTGNLVNVVGNDYQYLVMHNLLRWDNMIEERVRDIVSMTVSGDAAPYTITTTSLTNASH